jgi:signal transduction histidine kinase
VIGHDIDDLIVTREGVREMVSHHFSTEENQDDDETDTIRYFHRRSGETFPCQIEIKKFDFDEKNSYTIFILTDVTETEENRMKSEQLAQRAFLGDFASLLAHEIRNPVNNMNVWIQNIKSLCHEDDEIYKAAHRIEDDCSRVSHLVTNILAYSKPLKLNLEEVDLASFLLDLLERWKINFVRSNIKYYFSPPDNFPKIMGDPRALEQVFNNLIGNAIDAFDNKGGVISLKISLYQPETGGRKALISVSDNGPGIPDDMIDHIFEPFVTSKKKGNGWGLAISKRIVTSHKGSIQVKSYPGGTVFEILLPIINGA